MDRRPARLSACRSCGAAIPAGSACPICGAPELRFDAAPSGTADEAVLRPSGAARARRTVLPITAGLLLAAVITATVAWRLAHVDVPEVSSAVAAAQSTAATPSAAAVPAPSPAAPQPATPAPPPDAASPATTPAAAGQGVDAGALVTSLSGAPQAAGVAATLTAYFTGINDHVLEPSWQQLTSRQQRNIGSLSAYAHSLQTTTDDVVVLRSVDTRSGGGLVARVTFTSVQDGAYGPNPDETCTNWDLTYRLVPGGGAGGYLIDGTTDATHEACPVDVD